MFEIGICVNLTLSIFLWIGKRTFSGVEDVPAKRMNFFCRVTWNGQFIGETVTRWGTINPLWSVKGGIQR
jgi:hypothetical protein